MQVLALAKHLTDLSTKFRGLSCAKVKELAFQNAVANSVQVPLSWISTSRAGKDWLRLFMTRHNQCRIYH